MRSPIYGFIAFLVVEGLVGAGFINRENAADAQVQMEEVVFFLFLAGMGLAGFHKFIDGHKHHNTTEAEIRKSRPVVVENNDTVKIYPNTDNVFTPPPTTQNPGTPPVGNEQKTDVINDSSLIF